MLVLLAGCASDTSAPAVAEAPPAPKPAGITCTPTQASDPMVGTWYSVSRQNGVAGDVQTLTVLTPDGRMHYETQLKVGRKIRPALREAGCWKVADGVYTMQTTVSNGEEVDLDDPIYVNRYQIEKLDRSRMTLRALKGNGQVFTAQRVPAGYQLPF